MGEKCKLIVVFIGGLVLLGGGIVMRLFKISGSEYSIVSGGMFLCAAACVLYFLKIVD